MPSKDQITALFLGLAACALPASASPQLGIAERIPERGGPLLYEALGCGNCHREAKPAAPDLTDLSSRVQHAWVVDFLAQPGQSRMPAMFEAIPAGEKDQAIRDVAAWLGTLGGGLKFKVQRHADAERGSALYHEIGCVACHAPGADFRPVGEPSPYAVALPDLAGKTGLLALQHFLSHTGNLRPDQRMPQLPMDEQEALDIAAHLLDFQSSDPREAAVIEPWPKADGAALARGKSLVEKLNCAACHQLPGIRPQQIRPAAPRGGGGDCLAGDGPARYTLSEAQRAALAAFLEGGRRIGDAVDERVLLGRLNCYACHGRGGIGGPTPETERLFVGDASLADAGRLPPSLDGVGRKLRPAWLRAVIAGKEDARVRPYLRTRMPVYPEAVAAELAETLRLLDADLPMPEIAAVDDLDAGRKLLGTHGGANCITCHRWGERPSLGIQGMDLSRQGSRLSPEWFRSLLLEPARFRPGTLMPPLWPGGKSQLPEVLGGDTEKQIGAIWAFIRDGQGLPEGYPERATGEFELVPKERAIIQRTFLDGVGTHAILVGFPGGISLAYDAAKAQPCVVWQGRFFDAYTTWFSRFAPFEKPLGDKLHWFEGAEVGARFLGYELDTAGNPTFLSSSEGVEIAESFAVKDGTLVRTLRWDKSPAPRYKSELGGVRSRQSSAPGETVITYFWE